MPGHHLLFICNPVLPQRRRPAFGGIVSIRTQWRRRGVVARSLLRLRAGPAAYFRAKNSCAARIAACGEPIAISPDAEFTLYGPVCAKARANWLKIALHCDS